jgi:hypothetical protein
MSAAAGSAAAAGNTACCCCHPYVATLLTFVYMSPVRMAPAKCSRMYKQLCPCIKMDTPKKRPAYSTAKHAMAAYATLLSLHTCTRHSSTTK